MFYMTFSSATVLFIIFNFEQNPPWPPFWMISQAPATPQPIIFNSSCRAYHLLSTKGKISSKHCETTKPQGEGGAHPPPPVLYLGGGMSLLVRFFDFMFISLIFVLSL